MRTLTLSMARPARRLWMAAIALAAVLAPTAGQAYGMALIDEPPFSAEAGADIPAWEQVTISAYGGSEATTSPWRGPAPAPAPMEGRLPAQPRFPGAGTARVDVKCWQEGVLIVNETRLVAADEPCPYSIKFPSALTGGVPTYIADARNATCLIKPSGEAEAAPRRR
jgi:hypothetical protein